MTHRNRTPLGATTTLPTVAPVATAPHVSAALPKAAASARGLSLAGGTTPQAGALPTTVAAGRQPATPPPPTVLIRDPVAGFLPEQEAGPQLATVQSVTKPGEIPLQSWLAQDPSAIRQELGYGGLRAPSKPKPVQTPGEPRPGEPLATYVRRVMREWGHPFPQSDQATPGRYLSTMVRSNTVVERDPDGSSAIIEFLWSVRRDVLIAFTFQNALTNGALGNDTAADLARRLQANYKVADLLGALEKLVPHWEKAIMIKIMRSQYPIELDELQLATVPQSYELRARVANLLTEMMWLVRRINALVKHEEPAAAAKWLPRAVQVRSAIIHLGGAAYLPEWQDLYIDRALDLLGQGVVSKNWPLFSKHD